MTRTITCRLDGTDVLQTTTVRDDNNVLQSEDVARLGNRDIVLAQVNEQLTLATVDRDGIAAATTTVPVPAVTGTPNAKESLFYLIGGNVYRIAVERNSEGKIASQRTSIEGERAVLIVNSEARFQELTTVRNAISAAV